MNQILSSAMPADSLTLEQALPQPLLVVAERGVLDQLPPQILCTDLSGC